MPFPFTVKYTTSLKPGFGQDNYAEILELIADYLSHKSTKNVVTSADQLTFKANGGRNDIMGTIEKGTFKLCEQDDEVTLTYEFYMYYMLIITLIMAGAMGLIFQQYWFILIGYFWLGGMNWLTAIVRHRRMFKEITAGINELFR